MCKNKLSILMKMRGKIMRVEPSQLIPGCILIHDVMGKTNRPIMYEDTVLTEKLITILKKFLIPTVEVSNKLENGEIFKPDPIHQEKDLPTQHADQIEQQEYEKVAHTPFVNQYLEVVQEYKKLFHSWQYNTPIDMPYVRKLIIPLLNRIDTLGIDVFKLHHFSTESDYLYHHSVSVGILSAFIAQKLGYEKGEWLQVGLAGFLSDSGMAKINIPIIRKNRSLTYREMQEVKKHPEYSYHLVESIPTITKKVKLAIVQHHERLDGTGYPFQLKNYKIHEYARIIAVCDTYHAMTCNRGYQEALSPFIVINELKQEKFRGLDPTFVEVLIHNLVNLSVGVKVQLSNNKVGKIIFIDKQIPNQPMIQLDHTDEIIKLDRESNLYIKDILKEQ